MIENTTAAMRSGGDARFLLDALAGGSPIEAQEARGQAQLVASQELPTEGSDDPQLASMGFTFDEPHKDDPMFRPATLPAGWTRTASDHAMWSYLIDELGRRRVAIFYKAAFYDRRAFMRVETPTSYLYTALYDNAPPVLDDAWLSRDVAVTTLTDIAARYTNDLIEAEGRVKGGGQHADYWSGRVDELNGEIAKVERLHAHIAALGVIL